IEILEMTPQAVFALGAECKLQGALLSNTHIRQRGEWRVVEGVEFIEQCCRSLGIGLGLGAVLVRTWAQKDVGHFNQGLEYSDDLEMVLRLAVKGKAILLDGALCIRREHSSQ